MNEFTHKQQTLQALLERYNLDGIVLKRVSSFAWATCGAASYVNTAVSDGEATLLVTRKGRWLITNNIEATRLQQEEQLERQGWEFQVEPWHAPGQTLGKLTRGLKLGADGAFPGALDLSDEIALLRASLTPEEADRFRMLGRLCARAMHKTVSGLRPRQTEHEIAARMAREAERLGVQAIVNLVATDERIFRFRHPLPTQKKMEKYALLVLCGRRAGLVCSISRLVHFGTLPEELRRKARAVAQIDAALIAGTCPGRTLGEILQNGIEMYARTGFADEWTLHHQGGLAGYEPREVVARPGVEARAAVRQAFAWNPSITGTKSEDTILVVEMGYQNLTEMEGWPIIPTEINGQIITRPDILEIL